ncbi:MAG TPA: flagellar hook-length control protein FliK, partial [Rhizomicrobium sp.]|nr:flagellar hook-length control protein FliK [Rhizomicrobium sp.]
TADGDNALAALDAADTAETAPPPDEQETLLPAQESKPEKNTAAKADGAADAASGSGAAVGAQVPHAATAQQTAEKPADAVTEAASAVAGAPVTGASAVNAQADSAVAVSGTAQAHAADVKAGKTSDPAVQGTAEDAIQDAKALPADKAAALADMAEKTVRQATADTAVQARALPVQGAAQAPAPHHGDDGKSGSKEHQQAQTTQPAPGTANASAQADPQQVAQPASATHSSAQAPGAPSVASVTAPTLPQAQGQAPATVQVAQQMPLAAQPDFSALAVQIATQSKDGAQHFSIRLDPAELGRVDVRLSIDHTGHAQAHLSVEKPQTLDLLQRDRNDLERALKDSGIDLSQSGLNFSLKGQERHGEQPTTFKGRSRALGASLAIDSANAATTASIHHFAGGSARLDIRV